jgi:hypothetical protein
MGNRGRGAQRAPAPDTLFSNLVLAAPTWMPPVRVTDRSAIRPSPMATVYMSSQDKALRLSRWLDPPAWGTNPWWCTSMIDASERDTPISWATVTSPNRHDRRPVLLVSRSNRPHARGSDNRANGQTYWLLP